MGLFRKKEICCICGVEEGNQKISDGKVCRNCLRRTGILYRSLLAQTRNSILDAIECNNRLLVLQKQFHVSKQVGKYIEFDDIHKYGVFSAFVLMMKMEICGQALISLEQQKIH